MIYETEVVVKLTTVGDVTSARLHQIIAGRLNPLFNNGEWLSEGCMTSIESVNIMVKTKNESYNEAPGS